MLNRYRFKTRSVDDFRPLKDLADYWCTGFSADDSYANIVAYLPTDIDLFEYWNDAYDIDCEVVDEIIYTRRFEKPEQIK